MGPAKQPKTTHVCKKNTLKTHPRWTHAQTLSLKGAKPLKLIPLTHFWLFFQMPGGHKRDQKWELKWSLRALKIAKSRGKRALEKSSKRNTAKSRFLAPFLIQKGTTLSSPGRPDNHNYQRNPPNGSSVLQNGTPGPIKWPAITFLTPQKQQKDIAQLLERGTVAGYAQRTG